MGSEMCIRDRLVQTYSRATVSTGVRDLNSHVPFQLFLSAAVDFEKMARAPTCPMRLKKQILRLSIFDVDFWFLKTDFLQPDKTGPYGCLKKKRFSPQRAERECCSAVAQASAERRVYTS